MLDDCTDPVFHMQNDIKSNRQLLHSVYFTHANFTQRSHKNTAHFPQLSEKGILVYPNHNSSVAKTQEQQTKSATWATKTAVRERA